MDDLRRRFASLDDVPAPDLWDDVERRAARDAPVGSADPVPAVRPAWSEGPSRSLALLLAVAVLLIAIVAAILAGSSDVRLPAVVPLPAPTGDPSPTPVPDTSPAPVVVASTGLVVYALEEQLRTGAECEDRPWRCTRSRLWIADADGSGAHLLLSDDAEPLGFHGWSPDGTRILYQDSSGAFWLVAPDGSGAQQVGTYDTLCEPRCTNLEELAFSPDGSRLAYAAGRSPESGDTSILAIYEFETGRITELGSTAVAMDGMFCDEPDDQGRNDPPRWSPDGSRLAFARQTIGPRNVNGFCRSALYTVAADGSDLRLLVPPELYPVNPQWSPDGSVIAFQSAELLPSPDPNRIDSRGDIFTIGADGSELRRLTSDGASSWPSWTRDGRLVFVRWLDPEKTIFESWIMDADGGNAAPLPGDELADLSAVGCIRCLYPPGNGLTAAYWQPTP